MRIWPPGPSPRRFATSSASTSSLSFPSLPLSFHFHPSFLSFPAFLAFLPPSFLPSFIHSFTPSFSACILPSLPPSFLSSFRYFHWTWETRDANLSYETEFLEVLPSFLPSNFFLPSFLPSFLQTSSFLPFFLLSLLPSFLPSFLPLLPSLLPFFYSSILPSFLLFFRTEIAPNCAIISNLTILLFLTELVHCFLLSVPTRLFYYYILP